MTEPIHSEATKQEGAITKRMIVAVIATHSDKDDSEVAADLADDLRDQGWEPVSISVNHAL